MIILLGATGYVGQAFQRELFARGEPVYDVSRKQIDYTRYEVLSQFLRDTRPSFLINAAGYTGRPNVDACESAKADTLQGNVLLPATISHACQATGVPWGHVSSGCIFDGAKFSREGATRIETDLTQPKLRPLLLAHSPGIRGFSEDDSPNFTFRSSRCSFYSGTKALAEEALKHDDRVYLWRMRMPFDQFENARNYLAKLQRYPKIYENFNSLSHLGDYVAACLDLIKVHAPFGTYNVTNPGYVATREVVEMIQKRIAPERKFEYWQSDDEFYGLAAKTPRSNCILDVTKLLNSGVRIRPIHEALDDALKNWQREHRSMEPPHFRTAIQQGVQ